MIFASLSDRLQATFKKLRGHGKLTEDDVNEAMREVRMALLEADVNFKVVKEFIKRVKERAIGQDILETLTPAQVVIKIVDEELTNLMGGTQSRLNISPKPPTVIMMAGLQRRQDDVGRQAGPCAQEAGQASAARRGGYLPPGCRHAAAGTRQAAGDPGVRDAGWHGCCDDREGFVAVRARACL